MARCRLRVYHGPEESLSATPGAPQGAERSVTLTLAEVAPLLADAIRDQRTWLRDFDNDPVSISTDLYEVLLAYQHYRRPTA